MYTKMNTDAEGQPTPPPSYNQAVGGVEYLSPPPPYLWPPVIEVAAVPVGPEPFIMTCPHCHAVIMTKVSKGPGMIAYINGLIIAMFGCVFGCCLIPCCVDECMVVHHSCPNCKAYIGRYH